MAFKDKVVRGENVVLYLFDDTTWKLYACGRSCTIDVVTELLETTVSGSGAWKTYKPTVNSFSGTFDGVVNLDEPAMLTLPQLRALQIAHTELMFRFQRTSESGDVYTDEGMILITGSSDTGTYNDVNSFSINFTGNGSLTQLFVVTPGGSLNSDMRYEYTGGGSEYGFTDALLSGKYILEAVKDGIGSSKILTSGTPVNKEVLYNTSTGELTWAVPWEQGEEGYILYRNL